MNKYELVQMFGKLVMYGDSNQKDIDFELSEWRFYTQMYLWNDIGCELNMDKGSVGEVLTPDKVKDLCAEEILLKIGRLVEVNLCRD